MYKLTKSTRFLLNSLIKVYDKRTLVMIIILARACENNTINFPAHFFLEQWIILLLNFYVETHFMGSYNVKILAELYKFFRNYFEYLLTSSRHSSLIRKLFNFYVYINFCYKLHIEKFIDKFDKEKILCKSCSSSLIEYCVSKGFV